MNLAVYEAVQCRSRSCPHVMVDPLCWPTKSFFLLEELPSIVRRAKRTRVLCRQHHLQSRLHGLWYFRIHSFGRERSERVVRREATERGFIATHIAHYCASHVVYMLQEVSGSYSPLQKSRTMGSELQCG